MNIRFKQLPASAYAFYSGTFIRKWGNAVTLWSVCKLSDNKGFQDKMAKLDSLNFDNTVLRKLPIDPLSTNTARQVSGACFSRVQPSPVENPQVVAFSGSALQLLDISADEVEKTDFAEYFSGNKLFKGSETAAHCYCGHQFGYFSGQLGDGAAM